MTASEMVPRALQRRGVTRPVLPLADPDPGPLTALQWCYFYRAWASLGAARLARLALSKEVGVGRRGKNRRRPGLLWY